MTQGETELLACPIIRTSLVLDTPVMIAKPGTYTRLPNFIVFRLVRRLLYQHTTADLRPVWATGLHSGNING
jgi:hypothetical protein